MTESRALGVEVAPNLPFAGHHFARLPQFIFGIGQSPLRRLERSSKAELCPCEACYLELGDLSPHGRHGEPVLEHISIYIEHIT